MNDSGITIEDLGSTNGTIVNGNKLAPNAAAAIKAGDKMSFGGYEMALSVPGASAATQVFTSNKTAAIASAPKLEPPAAFLVGSDMRLPLKKGLNIFGRKAENDVQIPDPYVSGKHGVIEVADDGVYLTDTGSTNGTIVNDAKLAPQQKTKLGPDDEIKLGSIVLKVEQG